ncbi:hypothetical protein LJC17_04360 [Acholeplasma sp. OttesenSCG-928-E16]|nr:hypothetical protein [Acholeplasma sp. OttesenSCG-928-E16]
MSKSKSAFYLIILLMLIIGLIASISNYSGVNSPARELDFIFVYIFALYGPGLMVLAIIFLLVSKKKKKDSLKIKRLDLFFLTFSFIPLLCDVSLVLLYNSGIFIPWLNLLLTISISVSSILLIVFFFLKIRKELIETNIIDKDLNA